MSMASSSATDSVVLQRCGSFVARTENWLYDHLRFVPRYTSFVLCDRRLNREEFPALDDWCLNWSLTRRTWRRLTKHYLYPKEVRQLRRLAPCLLHSHFGGLAITDYALKRALDVPWIVSFYGADVYEGDYTELQRKYVRLFEHVTRILALGPVMKARLESLGCPAAKIDIHPLGVAVEDLPCQPRVLKSGEVLRILYAGTFREKKGIPYLVEAVARVHQAGGRFELHLVGDAGNKPGDHETKEEIFYQIGKLGLEKVVTHHSFLSFQGLIDLALRSHVFVAPSVTATDGDAEGTPFVIQQMMATGMPVIATDHSDIPYLFGEQKHLLVPERDAGAIADRLRCYMDDPDTLVKDGTRLRNRIRAFNICERAARLSDLYDAIR